MHYAVKMCAIDRPTLWPRHANITLPLDGKNILDDSFNSIVTTQANNLKWHLGILTMLPGAILGFQPFFRARNVIVFEYLEVWALWITSLLHTVRILYIIRHENSKLTSSGSRRRLTVWCLMLSLELGHVYGICCHPLHFSSVVSLWGLLPPCSFSWLVLFSIYAGITTW